MKYAYFCLANRTEEYENSVSWVEESLNYHLLRSVTARAVQWARRDVALCFAAWLRRQLEIVIVWISVPEVLGYV